MNYTNKNNALQGRKKTVFAFLLSSLLGPLCLPAVLSYSASVQAQVGSVGCTSTISRDARLSSLAVQGASLVPAFNWALTSQGYTVTVPTNENVLVIEAIPRYGAGSPSSNNQYCQYNDWGTPQFGAGTAHPHVRMTRDGIPVALNPVWPRNPNGRLSVSIPTDSSSSLGGPVAEGDAHTIVITTVAPNLGQPRGATQVYTIVVRRSNEAGPLLSSLSVADHAFFNPISEDNGGDEHGFAPDTLTYTLEVPGDVDTVTVNMETTNASPVDIYSSVNAPASPLEQLSEGDVTRSGETVTATITVPVSFGLNTIRLTVAYRTVPAGESTGIDRSIYQINLRRLLPQLDDLELHMAVADASTTPASGDLERFPLNFDTNVHVYRALVAPLDTGQSMYVALSATFGSGAAVAATIRPVSGNRDGPVDEDKTDNLTSATLSNILPIESADFRGGSGGAGGNDRASIVVTLSIGGEVMATYEILVLIDLAVLTALAFSDNDGNEMPLIPLSLVFADQPGFYRDINAYRMDVGEEETSVMMALQAIDDPFTTVTVTLPPSEDALEPEEDGTFVIRLLQGDTTVVHIRVENPTLVGNGASYDESFEDYEVGIVRGLAEILEPSPAREEEEAAASNDAIQRLLTEKLLTRSTHARSTFATDAIKQRFDQSTPAGAVASASANPPVVAAEQAWSRSGYAGNSGMDILKQLSNQSLNFSLTEGTGEEDQRLVSFWVVSQYVDLSGDDREIEYDGEAYGVSLGIDGNVSPNALVGISLNWADINFDYSTPSDTQDYDYGYSSVSLNPYIHWSASSRLAFWGMVGFGRGDIESEIANAAGTGSEELSDHAEYVEGAAGARYHLTGPGKIQAHLSGDLFANQTDPGGTQEEIVTSRSRLLLELSYNYAFGERHALVPSIEAALRYDGGDGDTGLGFEVSGELAYRDSRSGSSIEGRVRYFDAPLTEGWGASLLANVRLANRLGSGLTFSIGPSVGQTHSRIDSLLNQDQVQFDDAGRRELDKEIRLTSRIAYALVLPNSAGLKTVLTPYIQMNAGGDQMDLSFGQVLNITEALSMNMKASHNTASGRQYAGLELNWHF